MSNPPSTNTAGKQWPFLEQEYKQAAYLEFLAEKFDFSKGLAPITINNDEVKSFQQLGFVTTHDDKQLPVFEIHIKANTKLSRNRVQLRNLVAKQIDSEDGALAVYIDDKNKQWRFSFIAIEYKWTEDGTTEMQTASKRFTYLLGENAKTRTAKERFAILNQQSTLEALKRAFAVEPLNKEFYDKLYTWYEKAQTQVVFPNDEQAENHTQTSLIRLLTRLLFIWFIKEKGLINADLFDKDKLQTLIDYDKPSSFYKAILQNLFFATLNRPITERSFRTTTNGVANPTNYLVTNIYRYQGYFINSSKADIMRLFIQAPFLNGGLFECLDREANEAEKQAYNNDHSIRPIGGAIRIDGFSDKNNNQLKFDNGMFFNNENDLGLIDLFNQYQFTVEESTPLDVEVALDPELLGKVFENLLATYNPETGQQARKATGSFYTPREIVGYMVDESLKQYFIQHTDLNQEQIDNLFIEEKDKLNEQQIKNIIHAIDNIKILDPAVGSGAYPMGVLQKLVLILEKIDPQNIHFKQQQIDTAEQIQDEASRKSAIGAIEQVFSQQNQHNAYGKKLYLIEKCIYGVDIQPIAIQICKLRFFISLAIEQTPNQDERDNYGIKALPNLETKFIVANSLLPLGEMDVEKGKSFGMFDKGIKVLQQQLAEVRHKYFSAKTLKTKRKYREQDKSLRQQMLDELMNNSNITREVKASMQKIVDWDLYNQNAVADWFDPEWQFGVKDGFDIVIGNPPYVGEKNNKQLFLKIKQGTLAKYYQGRMDIFYFFFHISLNIAKKNGIISFITTNYFVTATYAKKLRMDLKNRAIIIKMINFNELKIFQSALGQHNIITILQKGKNLDTEANSSIANTNEYNDSQWLQDFFAQKDGLGTYSMIAQRYLYDGEQCYIRLVHNQITQILKKLPSNCFQLSDVCHVNQGIVTGADKVNKSHIEKHGINAHIGEGIFVLNNDEVKQLQPNTIEQSMLKPWFKNSSISKYFCDVVSEKVVIYSNGKHEKEKIHNVIRHLSRFNADLKQRREGQKNSIGWHHLWRARTEKIFLNEKIITPQRSKKNTFAYNNTAWYASADVYFITSKIQAISLKYILALLNSRFYYVWLYYKGKRKGEMLELYQKPLSEIPIPQISKPAQQPFIDLVDKILIAKQQAQDTSVLEAKIDKMVYKLYNLTASEIRIVEGKKE